MTELVDADALIVVAIERQAEQILLAKARRLAARAPHALVLIGRIGVVSIFGHIGIDLILADDDQVHAAADHLPRDIRAPRQQVRYDFMGALQGRVRYLLS